MCRFKFGKHVCCRKPLHTGIHTCACGAVFTAFKWECVCST